MLDDVEEDDEPRRLLVGEVEERQLPAVEEDERRLLVCEEDERQSPAMEAGEGGDDWPPLLALAFAAEGDTHFAVALGAGPDGEEVPIWAEEVTTGVVYELRVVEKLILKWIFAEV